MLVIGGGITGAGVALDAATRGYSVALIERARLRAAAPRSRSTKLVHGGLRYLQNFDLGLVREALLERQINVNLAPYLVRPLRFVVPAFDGARLDRVVGLGLNAYDVMAVDRLAPPAPRRRRDRLEPGAPPRDLRRRGDRAAARARRPHADRRLPVLRLPDRRRPAGPDRAGRGRALRRRGRQPARGGRAAARTRGRAVGARVRDAESGDELEVRATNVVNATGVWADRLRPAELHDEAEVPVIRPEPRHAPGGRRRGAADERRRDRPRRRGPDDLRAAVARADADRHDRHRPRRRRRPRPARPTPRSPTCSTPSTRSSPPRSTPATSPARTRACGR